VKEGYAYGYEAQVYFPKILDCYTHQDSTTSGKGLISIPTTPVSNIPRHDKENGIYNMTVIDEDQQSWLKTNLVRNMTLRNGKQIGAIKGHEGQMMAATSTDNSNNSAENEESIDSYIRAVNQRLQLYQPLSDFPTACDEIGAMKVIGKQVGIDFETNRENTEVIIHNAIDVEKEH